MANPTTYFGWVMPTSSSLVTNLPADFNTFGQGVDTSLQDLLGGTTGQVLSKTSNTNMDFTWVTPTDQTPLTTKGDIFAFSTVDARLPAGANETRLVADSTQTLGLKYVADTTNYAIAAKGDLLGGTAADTLAALSVGTNGQVLTADSTAATGLAWATAASGGGMTLLSTTTISGTTTISSISGSYKHLLLNLKGVTSTVDGNSLQIRFNSDSGGNYYHAMIRAISSTLTASFDNADTSVQVIPRIQSSSTVGKLGSSNVWIMRYTDTDYIDGFCQAQGHNGTDGATFHKTFRYDCTAAITSITLLNDTGTIGGTAYLYGVS